MSTPRRRRGARLFGGAYLCACVVVISLSGGCVSKGRPPVADRSPVNNPAAASYVVQPGDTLYSIAWRHDRDFRHVAALNAIAAPFQIVPGQRLRLTGRAVASAPGPKTPATQAPVTRTPKTSKTTPAKPIEEAADPQRWAWPVSTQPIKPFGSAGNKGIDFGLSGAANIRSAAGGEVVYAGAGLGGYRYLVIVKHSERYLSAYGFDAVLRVLEGQQIKANAVLADISGESIVQSLHFELRRDGVPINPAGVIGR